MKPSDALQLLIRINRVFDAVACTWTGEAKTCIHELVKWSEAHDWETTPDLLAIKEAIATADDRSRPWDQRCIPLSNAVGSLELRLATQIRALEFRGAEGQSAEDSACHSPTP